MFGSDLCPFPRLCCSKMWCLTAGWTHRPVGGQQQQHGWCTADARRHTDPSKVLQPCRFTKRVLDELSTSVSSQALNPEEQPAVNCKLFHTLLANSSTHPRRNTPCGACVCVCAQACVCFTANNSLHFFIWKRSWKRQLEMRNSVPDIQKQMYSCTFVRTFHLMKQSLWNSWNLRY